MSSEATTSYISMLRKQRLERRPICLSSDLANETQYPSHDHRVSVLASPDVRIEWRRHCTHSLSFHAILRSHGSYSAV